MAWRQFGPGLLLLVLGTWLPGAAVRLAPGARAQGEGEVPAVLEMMPGFQRPSGAAELFRTGSKVMERGHEAAEGGQRSEAALHVLKDPWWVGNEKLQLVTVETRPNRTKIDEMTNIGTDAPWEGYVTKLELMNRWLRKQKDETALVIFVDGEDTFFGGCGEDQFLRDYQELVSRSGGIEVIVGAERGCYECPRPWSCGDIPEAPEWAHRDWDAAAGGTLLRSSKVEPTGQMRYINSGFVAGPVGKLRPLYAEALKDMLNWEEEGRQRGDQYYVARYVLKHPERVVPDYSSTLVTCGYSLNMSKLFELRPRGGLYNTVTKRQQCFFHANGPAFKMCHGIRPWQRGGPRPPW